MKRIYLIGIMCIALLAVSCSAHYDNNAALKQKQNEAEAFSNLLAQKPDSTGLRLIVANKLDSIGEYRSALLQLDTLLQADSTKYGLWMAKANIFSDSNNIPEVKKCLQKAIGLYGGIEALTSLGEIYADEKNDSALLLAKQLDNLSRPQADYILALYYFNVNDGKKADSLLNRSMLQDHYFAKNFLLKGKILLQKNHAQDAIDNFKDGLKAEPKNIALLNNIAGAYIKLKQPDSAKAYYIKSLTVQAYQPKISEQLKTL